MSLEAGLEDGGGGRHRWFTKHRECRPCSCGGVRWRSTLALWWRSSLWWCKVEVHSGSEEEVQTSSEVEVRGGVGWRFSLALRWRSVVV
ncbi:unnamed protein product [Boreogadus saida]